MSTIADDIMETYPSYLSEAAQERIDARLEERVHELFSVLRAEFGRSPTKAMDTWAVRDVLRSLAVDVSHEAAGAMSDEAFKQAQQSSANLLNGVLAGIQLGKGDASASAPAPEGDR